MLFWKFTLIPLCSLVIREHDCGNRKKNEKKNHETRQQPSKLKENHFYWKKSQKVRENEKLNILNCEVLPKRRMAASKSYIFAVNVYDDHIHKILGWRTR